MCLCEQWNGAALTLIANTIVLRLLILRLREHRSAVGTADDSPFAQEASVPLISEDFLTNESELVARNVEKSEDADTKASDLARPTSDASPQLQVV